MLVTITNIMVEYSLIPKPNLFQDFPRIPGSKLPQLRAIAPEYYDSLPCHSSWSKVMYEFVIDPTVSCWSRVVRPSDKDE
jgi:sphingolipid delta-4 desaturase